MTMTDTLKAACLLALTVAFTNAPAATKKEVDQALSQGGLQKIEVKDIDLAYARPGASLAAYKRVKLDPVEVEFRKSKDPSRAGSAIKLSSEERERIRSNVARAVQEEFAKELQKSSAYQVASDAGPGVLRVKPRIIDLYVSAPDVGPGRTRTLVSSAGEMMPWPSSPIGKRPGTGARRRPARRQQGGQDVRRERDGQRAGSAKDRCRLGADPAQRVGQGARHRLLALACVPLPARSTKFQHCEDTAP